MRLADGTPAVAGVRVVAINASSRGNYLMDATGVISKINPGDPDPHVRWDHNSTKEFPASRGKLKLARMSGNATLWDQTAVDVGTCAPDDKRGSGELVGGRLVMKDSKCCVATLVTHPTTTVWVVNVHLVHDNQDERIEQLEKVLGWLEEHVHTPTPAAAVLLCGDFNACQRTREYKKRIQPLLESFGFDPLEFESAVGGVSCPITFPKHRKTLDYAFARNIGGTVTCLDNQRLSDHNGLRITLDGGLIVLCFNAHFGTDAHELAQPPIAYADFITRSGAAVVCMQECDWGQTTGAADRPVHQARSIREALEVGGSRSWSGWLYAARKCGRTRMKNYARYRYLWQRGDVVWRDEVWSLGDV